jgi:hypothetical protein
MGSIFKAPKIPDPAPMVMPKVEDVPEADDPAVLAAEEEAQRKRDRNRKGRRSTILTGTGLNEIEDANIDQKSLLGS